MNFFAAQTDIHSAPPRQDVDLTAQRTDVEVTLLAKADGPLTKRIALDAAGRVISDGSGCTMAQGQATRMRLRDPAELAALIGAMPPDRAIALGRLRGDLPDDVPVVTQRKLAEGRAAQGAIARTRDFIDYAAGKPAFALLDYDRKGMPAAVAQSLERHGGFWPALLTVAPDLARAARVYRASTSAGLLDARTGEPVGAVGGEHVYLLVRDGSDIERFLRDLHERCWLYRLGWYLVGAAGQLLERSVVDRMVGAPERLAFEGAPIVVPPLDQDHAARAPSWSAGEALDTRTACPPLTRVEKARIAELKRASQAAAASEARQVRVDADRALARRIAERLNVPSTTAQRMVEARHRGILLPSLELVFDDPEIGTVTAGEVLRDPEQFVGETLADPLEGLDYGRCKAMVMRRDDGALWINSFAHGRAAYELKLDAPAVEAALRAADKTAVVDELERQVLEAHLAPDELDHIVRVVQQISGAKLQPLRARLKHAKARRAREEAEDRARQQVTTPTTRIRLEAPRQDDERTPVLHALDEVLGAVDESEPPMRNADGVMVEVRARSPWGLHQLTDAGADIEEARRTACPPRRSRCSPYWAQPSSSLWWNSTSNSTERTRGTSKGARSHCRTPSCRLIGVGSAAGCPSPGRW